MILSEKSNDGSQSDATDNSETSRYHRRRSLLLNTLEFIASDDRIASVGVVPVHSAGLISEHVDA